MEWKQFFFLKLVACFALFHYLSFKFSLKLVPTTGLVFYIIGSYTHMLQNEWLWFEFKMSFFQNIFNIVYLLATSCCTHIKCWLLFTTRQALHLSHAHGTMLKSLFGPVLLGLTYVGEDLHNSSWVCWGGAWMKLWPWEDFKIISRW